MSFITRRRAALGAALLGLGAVVGTARWGKSQRPPGEIALWFSYGGKNRQVLLELVDQFHREQSAVRVHATFQGDYFEGLTKLRTGLFVGTVPSVTHVVGEVVPYLFEAGVLEPLDEIGEAVKQDLVPALSQSGTFTHGDSADRERHAAAPLVALPFNRSTPVAYYNVPLFAELGLEPPRTWADMRAVARAATKRGGSGVERWGFECPIDWWFWTALVGQAGGAIADDSGTIALGGAAGVAAIEHWQAMVHEDRSMKPPAGRDYNAWEATNSDFLAGRVAMIWTSTAFLRYLEDNASFAVGVAPLPKLVRFSVPTGGTFFVVPRGTSDRERESAITFLRWMMQPEQANAWATRTGYMPVSRTGLGMLEQAGWYRAHPNDKVTLDQLAVAQPWPWAPELFRVQREAVQPRLEAAVLERVDARKVMADALGALEGA